MDNSINEFKASSVEGAIELGLKELGIEKEDAEIEILSKGKLFSKAVVRIQKKEEKIAEINVMKVKESEGKEFLTTLLEKMNMNCIVEEKKREKTLCYFIKGEDANKTIGYRGENLDAIQYIMTQIINKEDKDFERIIVDADFYRQKREKTLTLLANRLARKAYERQKTMELEPMNSFERRIIHAAIQKSNIASTHSEGEGRNRHIVVVPFENNEVIKEETDENNYFEEKKIEYTRTNFNMKGPKRTKSYGYKNKRF